MPPSALPQPQPYSSGSPSQHDLYQQQQQVYEQRLQWQQQQMATYGAGQAQAQPSLQAQVQPQLHVQDAAQPSETNLQRLRRQQRHLLLSQRQQRRQPPLSPPLPVPSPVIGQPTGTAAPSWPGWPGAVGQAVPPRPPPSPRGLATVSFSLPRAATPAVDELAPGTGRLSSQSAPALWMRDSTLLLAPVGEPALHSLLSSIPSAGVHLDFPSKALAHDPSKSLGDKRVERPPNLLSRFTVRKVCRGSRRRRVWLASRPQRGGRSPLAIRCAPQQRQRRRRGRRHRTGCVRF